LLLAGYFLKSQKFGGVSVDQMQQKQEAKEVKKKRDLGKAQVGKGTGTSAEFLNVAKGYLTKGNDVNEMVQAIKDVHGGGRYIAKDIAQQLALSMLPGQDSIIDSLSKRELQILLMISQAHKNCEIAGTLNISPKTVSTYRKRLHEKLGVSTDIEMFHLAMKHGILDTDIHNKNK